MNHLFLGFLFTFLDFNLTLDTHVIGLIPDFLGYWFLIKGLDEMTAESALFAKARPFTIGMLLYSVIFYALDLVGLSTELGTIDVLLGIAGTLVGLYISYTIIMGVRSLEESYHADFAGEKLFFFWKWAALTQLLAYLTLFLAALAILCILACFVFSILFLVAFRQTQRMYEARRAWRETPESAAEAEPTDGDSDTDADSDTDTNSNTDTDRNTGSNIHADTVSDVNGDTDTDTDTNTDTNSDNDADTHNDSKPEE